MPFKRFPAECCRRLELLSVRSMVQLGDTACALKDGTSLQLRWAEVKGCFGGRHGHALLMVCPGCERSVRVLWRPPAGKWGCWRCNPISHRSHRRSGARKGMPKPTTWRSAQLMDQQRRCADLLGLAEWPPQQLIWGWEDLLEAPRRPDAPRVSHHRALALAKRLDALDALRLYNHATGMNRCMKGLGLPAAIAHADADDLREGGDAVLMLTGWAVRRKACDSRRNRTRQAASS